MIHDSKCHGCVVNAQTREEECSEIDGHLMGPGDTVIEADPSLRLRVGMLALALATVALIYFAGVLVGMRLA